MKIDRLLEIVIYLLNHENVSARDLAALGYEESEHALIGHDGTQYKYYWVLNKKQETLRINSVATV